MRRDPAAIRHRLVLDDDGSAVRHLDDGFMLSNGQGVAPGMILLWRHPWAAPRGEAHVDDLAQGRARADLLRGKIVEFGVATVRHDQPLRAVRENGHEVRLVVAQAGRAVGVLDDEERRVYCLQVA